MRTVAFGIMLTAACGASEPGATRPTTVDLVPPLATTAASVATSVAPVAERAPTRQLFLSGAAHTCVMERGEAWCWGFNGYGQLGVGSRADAATPARLPVDDIMTMDVGGVSTCVVRRGGALLCAGEHEMFGTDQHATDRGWLKPVPGFGPVRRVAVAVDVMCAETIDGVVRCVGSGDPVPAGEPKPVALEGLSRPLSLRVEPWYGCALVAGGELRCWGDPWMGLYGSGLPAGFVAGKSAAPVSGLRNVIQVSMGDQHVCARDTRGGVFCFGDNVHGKLGRVTRQTSDFAPARIDGVDDVVDVAAGGNRTCVLRRGGAVQCVGEDGTGRGTALHDVPMPDGERAVALRAGLAHTCALLASGDVACWGFNNYGQCGSEGGADVTVPQRIVIPPR